MSQVASPCVIMKSLMIDVCHMTAWQEQQCQAQHESGRFSLHDDEDIDDRCMPHDSMSQVQELQSNVGQ